MTTRTLTEAEQLAYDALRPHVKDETHLLRVVTELPQDTNPVRRNQGWFDGVEAARRATYHDDPSAYTLAYVGTPEYREAFQAAVQAFYAAHATESTS